MTGVTEEWSESTTYFEDDVVRCDGVDFRIYVDYFIGSPPTLENQIAFLKEELQKARAREKTITERLIALKKLPT